MHTLPVLLQDRENAVTQAIPKIDRLVVVGRAAGSDIPELERILPPLVALPQDADPAEVHAHLRHAEQMLA